MEETNPDIIEARAKLQAKFGTQGRIGGKGTQRRKVKAPQKQGAQANAYDDKKLQT